MSTEPKMVQSQNVMFKGANALELVRSLYSFLQEQFVHRSPLETRPPPQILNPSLIIFLVDCLVQLVDLIEDLHPEAMEAANAIFHRYHGGPPDAGGKQDQPAGDEVPAAVQPSAVGDSPILTDVD